MVVGTEILCHRSTLFRDGAVSCETSKLNLPEYTASHSGMHHQVKGKGKGYPRTGHEDPEEYRYRSTLSLTWKPDEVGSQRHAPAALPPGKTRYSLYRRLGGSQDRSGQVRKISPLTGVRSLDPPARSQLLYRLRFIIRARQ